MRPYYVMSYYLAVCVLTQNKFLWDFNNLSSICS